MGLLFKHDSKCTATTSSNDKLLINETNFEFHFIFTVSYEKFLSASGNKKSVMRLKEEANMTNTEHCPCFFISNTRKVVILTSYIYILVDGCS